MNKSAASGQRFTAHMMLLVSWLAATSAVFAWPFICDAPDIGDELTRRTVWVALAYYAAAVWVMLGLRPDDWAMPTARGEMARGCWTLAWVAYIIHVGMAFQFYHHWSHADAMRHNLERSGLAEGVYVSYAFTILWTFDVIWWWVSTRTYSGRPGWVDWPLHGFMAFIIVNATVVFGTGPVRWAELVLVVVLAIRWWRTRRPLASPTAGDSMPA